MATLSFVMVGLGPTTHGSTGSGASGEMGPRVKPEEGNWRGPRMLRLGLLSRLPLQRHDHGRHRRRRGSAGRSADFGGRPRA